MTDTTPWTGRVDQDDAGDARRWHQVVRDWRPGASPGVALAGFACDAGIARNQGRTGALANLAWHGGERGALHDAGDVPCREGQLEGAQREFGERVRMLLADGQFPLLLGGGHEIAWASYQGLSAHAASRGARIGVVNFDAHFDLRPLLPGDLGSSGTPFRQIAGHMAMSGQPVRYLCIGVARPANTEALYRTARQLGVQWIEDLDCQSTHLDGHAALVRNFVSSVDIVQLSVCLDVFPGSIAPGVSAPAGLGVQPDYLLSLLRATLAACQHGRPDSRLGLAEIAELSPGLDPAGMTARLAARLVHEIAQPIWVRGGAAG
jgi:formiminoglutamase